MLFANQVALVTGASGGIGSAIATALAAHGATVHMAGRNAQALSAIARGAGTRAVCDIADITDDRDVRGLKERIERECGRLDILVHAAGWFSMSPVTGALLDNLDHQYKINLRAPFAVTQALLPFLCRSRGQIIFINSTAGLHARANVSQYSASKQGLKAFADSLREEVNPAGVRVLSVFLGRTATPMQRRIHQLEAKRYCPAELIQPEDVAAAVIALLGLPRTVEVTNISMRPLKRPADPPPPVPDEVFAADGKETDLVES